MVVVCNYILNIKPTCSDVKKNNNISNLCYIVARACRILMEIKIKGGYQAGKIGLKEAGN